MRIYVDNEYKCHVTEQEGMTAVDEPFFDGKCSTFVEGHRVIPAGCSWIREDGKVFTGPMIAPWKDSRLMYAAQAEYERNAAQIAEMETAMKIIFEGEDE